MSYYHAEGHNNCTDCPVYYVGRVTFNIQLMHLEFPRSMFEGFLGSSRSIYFCMMLKYWTLKCSPNDIQAYLQIIHLYLLSTLASITTTFSFSFAQLTLLNSRPISSQTGRIQFPPQTRRSVNPFSLPAPSPSASLASSFPHPLPRAPNPTVTSLHPSAPICDDRKCIHTCLCLRIPGTRKKMIN